MDKSNIENITMELEDHKSQINETNIKNQIKLKNIIKELMNLSIQ